MNNEPLIPDKIEYLTFDQLLDLSLEEFKKSLGVPSHIVDADPPQDHFTGVGKLIQSAIVENSIKEEM